MVSECVSVGLLLLLCSYVPPGHSEKSCCFLGLLSRGTDFLYKVILTFPLMTSPGEQPPLEGVSLCNQHSWRALQDHEEAHGPRGG